MVAVVDSTSGALTAFSSVGTGFSDDDLAALTQRLATESRADQVGVPRQRVALLLGWWRCANRACGCLCCAGFLRRGMQTPGAVAVPPKVKPDVWLVPSEVRGQQGA